MNDFDLRMIFTYHAPKEGQPQKYENLREAGREIAVLIKDLVPDCEEKEIAINKVREAIMWANAAIAIHDR